MRRLFIILTVGLTVAVAPAAEAGMLRNVSADKDFVSLDHGRGVARLSGTGVLIGGFTRGKIRVTDLPGGRQTQVRVYGSERVTIVNSITRVYSGRHLTFRINTGRWKVGITARGINASAVLRGAMWLGGPAGTFAIAGRAKRSWPLELTRFALGG
jgi:hypothetical protein